MIFLLCFFSLSTALVYDVVVYKASPAGIGAAIAAASQNKTVALLEPTAYIGGMSSAGGIGLRDIGDVSTLNSSCLANTWAMMNAAHYGVTYPVWQPDNWVGSQNFLKLIESYPNIDLFLSVPLLEGYPNIQKTGTTINSIATGMDQGMVQWWNGQMFIDASYDGDILLAFNLSVTWGREAKSVYNETNAGVQPYTTFGQFEVPVDPTYPNGSLVKYVTEGPLAAVGSGDEKMMGYSYRVCLTTNVKNQAPFPVPNGYNSEDFQIMQRYIDALVSSGKYPNGPPFNYLVATYDYRSYPPADKYDLCDSNDAAVTSDVIGGNLGYINASYANRTAIANAHYYYVAGLLTYLSTDPRVPEYTRNSTLKYGLCADEWPENGHWPLQLYVREGVRIIGDRVFTQHDLVGGTCTNDSIGTTSWAIDIHVVQRVSVLNSNKTGYVAQNEGEMMVSVPGNSTVVELPYSLILPKRTEATNLLSPVLNSISHVAYGSVRVEPTFMQLGTAAGFAASLAVDGSLKVQDVDIKKLQGLLTDAGVYIHYPVGHCG